MFKNILVAYDGSPDSEHALKQAVALARLTNASLTVLSVVEKLPVYAATLGEVDEAVRAAEAHFARLHASAAEQARASGVTLNTAVRAGEAAQVIVQFADEGGFDLIVVGASGRRGLGGTADKVADQAAASVLIARSGWSSLRVRDIMNTAVVTVSPTTSVAEVAELLIRRQLKAIPVVEDRRVVGMITGGDLLQRAGMGLRLSVQRRLPPEALADQWQQLAAQGKSARDIMTSPVITVHAETRVGEAARLMVDKHLKRLPVVDRQGNLVGIVSRLDVLAAAVSASGPSEEPAALPTGQLRTAADVMFRDVPTVTPDAPLSEVISKLVATPLRRLVVIDELRRVLGIIVDADLLAQVSPRATGGALRALIARLSHAGGEAPVLSGQAADVMIRQVYTVHADAPLDEVVTLMLEKRVKRLVVTDAEGHLLGMVDRQSVLRLIAEQS